MQVQFYVYKFDVEETSDGGGRIRFFEHGTHHRFVAHFRDPRQLAGLADALSKLADAKGWRGLPPLAPGTPGALDPEDA